MFDLLIKNGVVVDGSGQARVRADIGITGEKITFIGDSIGKESKEVINAQGLIVSPGFIDTAMTMNISEKMKLFLTSRIPMGKLGTGEDVSNCVAFLSSEQASYITGETIHVNGGMYMA